MFVSIKCKAGQKYCAGDLDAAQTETLAKSDEKIAELLDGKTIVKAIVVPGRMVNFVVK